MVRRLRVVGIPDQRECGCICSRAVIVLIIDIRRRKVPEPKGCLRIHSLPCGITRDSFRGYHWTRTVRVFDACVDYPSRSIKVGARMSSERVALVV